MNRDNWKVGKEGIRPNGDPHKCFYCGCSLGRQHALDCVIRQKTVVIDITVRVVVDVPEHWGPDKINFRYNESTSCADNLIPLIDRAVESMKRISEDEREFDERPDGKSGCLCEHTRVEYIREATEQDEAAFDLKVAELPS
jgi:hypothetical protein